MRYTDELEPLLEREQALRREIALRIALETGQPERESPSEADMHAADEAIEAWQQDGEDDQDMRAFRPIGPLQHLLIEHLAICERIMDIRDRRLS